jgi:hypothetical protein
MLCFGHTHEINIFRKLHFEAWFMLSHNGETWPLCVAQVL